MSGSVSESERAQRFPPDFKYPQETTQFLGERCPDFRRFRQRRRGHHDPRRVSKVTAPVLTATHPLAAQQQQQTQGQQLTFSARQNCIYEGNGTFKYNNISYKVTLFSGNLAIEYKDVAPNEQPEWIKTAQKVIQTLIDADHLPGARQNGTTVDEVRIDFQNQTIEDRINGTGTQPINFQGRLSFNPKAIRLLSANILRFAGTIEIERQRSLQNPNMVCGNFNQFTFGCAATQNSPPINPGEGRNACTAISIITAMEMQQNSQFTPALIDQLHRSGISYDRSARHRLKDQIPAEGAPSEDDQQDLASQINRRLLTCDEVFAALPQNLRILQPTIPAEYEGDALPQARQPLITDILQLDLGQIRGIPIPQEPSKQACKAHFNNCLQYCINQLKTKLSAQNPKVSGSITIQGSSYALSVALDLQKQGQYIIEFSDSHGCLASRQKGYINTFMGPNATNDFVTFFSTNYHHSYIPQALLQPGAQPSDDAITEMINQHMQAEGKHLSDTSTDVERRQYDEDFAQRWSALRELLSSPISDSRRRNLTANLLSFTPVILEQSAQQDPRRQQHGRPVVDARLDPHSTDSESVVEEELYSSEEPDSTSGTELQPLPQ